VQEKDDEILSATETHLEHTRFLRLFIFATDRWSTHSLSLFLSLFFSLSLSLFISATSDDVKLIGEERGGSYNNTSADVPGRIESMARNEIAESNTFAVEDLFFEHDDNDRGIRSTLSKYCWRSRYFLVLFVFDTVVESIRVLEFRSSLRPYIIFSLSMLPHFPRRLVSSILYSTLKMTYVLSRTPA